MRLDGTVFGVSATASVGVVGAGTRLRFTQRGDRVLGRYAGGRIARGVLVGRWRGRTLDFRYAQRELAGGIHGGRSQCDIETLPDGRLRIHEHFQWETRDGSGTNVFDQLALPAAEGEG